MRKIIVLFKREYIAAVKTRSFIISLVLVPVLMAGSLIVTLLTENNENTDDKSFAVIDHSGLIEDYLAEQAEQRNSNDIYSETGEKVSPAYLLDFLEPDYDEPFKQKLKISDKIRGKKYHALIEIGKDILHPGDSTEEDYLRFYSEHGFMDDTRYWFSNNINNYLRELRLKELNLDPEMTSVLFAWHNIESMGLAKVDEKTGETKDAKESSELQTFLIPYVVVILMFMMTLMSAVPLLVSVMEEKSEKIAEVLLGKLTPFQFMAGKVMGGIGVGLTVAGVYIFGAIATVNFLDVGDIVPMDILVWFFIYLFFYIIMVGSAMAALGAMCNDNKDAQSLQFPAMFPVILPIFFIVPIISNPTGTLATTLAFIPPFTPTIMMIRIATPVTIPTWQPIVGLVGVILFTLFTVWAGARIFRTAILIQGQKPSLSNLVKYAFKS
ncbi:MAG: ABC transporter permease [Bacteroidales bacterium]|nr:ABC transporter permease [Bacteroidales bacterium]